MFGAVLLFALEFKCLSSTAREKSELSSTSVVNQSLEEPVVSQKIAADEGELAGPTSPELAKTQPSEVPRDVVVHAHGFEVRRRKRL